MRGSELEKYLRWEKLTSTQRHMILMYLFRVETEPMEELENYIETWHFRKYGIKRDDLPVAIASIKGIALKKAAYSELGLSLQETA